MAVKFFVLVKIDVTGMIMITVIVVGELLITPDNMRTGGVKIYFC